MNYFEITDTEYLEMAQDLEAMAEEKEQAVHDLKALYEGDRVVVPTSVEHAQSMFKVACYYLQHHDPNFKLRMSND